MGRVAGAAGSLLGIEDARPEALPFGALRVALFLQLAQFGRVADALVVEPRLYLVRFAPCLRLVAGAG